MTTMREPISAPAQATASWLTEALRSSGHLDRGEVTAVKCSDPAKTFTSNIAHLQLSYSSQTPPTAPERLFLKVSAQTTAPGSFGGDHFQREALFYQEVAGAMPSPPSIRCYDVAYSAETSRCHLLLDDIASSHGQSEHPLPPTDEQCKQGIMCLARFHAFWWQHPRIGVDIGRFRTPEERQTGVSETQEMIQAFVRFLGDSISTERRQIYAAVSAALPHLAERRSESRNLTLIHGDAHLWNFMFPHSDVDPTYIIDWQFWHPSVGTADLAFMIAREWYPERRRRLEQPMLRLYHETLLQSGIERYDWETCWQDYRLSVIQMSLLIPVFQWSLFKARPSMWWSGLERAMLAYEDLQCADLIDTSID